MRTTPRLPEEDPEPPALAEHGTNPARYELPDSSVGDVNGSNPLDGWSWQDLRDEIYGERKLTSHRYTK